MKLKSWYISNGGRRTGYVSYDDYSTGLTYPDWRTRTKSVPARTFASFAWNPNCDLPSSGKLTGRVQYHAAKPVVNIHSGNTGIVGWCSPF